MDGRQREDAMASQVLIGDIGGTNARFGLASPGSGLQTQSVREFPVAGFESLGAAARHYLEQLQATIVRAEFAVAGKVDGEEVRITNHPWLISASGTASLLGVERVGLLNDFAAQAMAITALAADDVAMIGPGRWQGMDRARDATFAVIGPGTGLGVGALLVREGRCFALETEGGHAGFAPTDEDDVRVLECLMRRFGRVSCERLVSGPGLSNLHEVACEIHGHEYRPLTPAQITAGAADGDAACNRAIHYFCAAFGAMAGDIVLTHGAWDGVFLAGGLVPRLLPALQAPVFRARFTSKGRFASAVARVPCMAVVHPQSGLLGAAAHALS